jgi:dipeptidyl aminopeptidase/acylaminoacyl peptidase
MNAVVMEPDLYKCSIPDAGPYELQLQWDKADSFQGNPEYKEYYLNRMVGSEDNIKDRSPVYHIDKLKAALFIVHGTEDVRVPIENAYLLEEHLNKKGIQYKKMYKEDGHGFQKEEYRVELYEEMLKFLKEHIGK